MRILITNIQLTNRSGSELRTRDLALELRARGHEVSVYTPRPGVVADEIGAAGVLVVTDPAKIEWTPDLIQGHHHIETVQALLAFPGVPALAVCRSPYSWFDSPPIHARVRRYVAVDLACQERLLRHNGVPADRIRLIPQGVDVRRFRPRAPLPFRPKRALVMSSHVPVSMAADIRRACDDAGIQLDVIGPPAGRVEHNPENVLPGYDIVFAIASSALEAITVGTATIVCGRFGLGPMVSRRNVEECWRSNGWNVTEPVTARGIAKRLADYDPAESERARDFVRQNATFPLMVDRWIALYEEILAEPRAQKASQSAELGEYLTSLVPIVGNWEAFGAAAPLVRLVPDHQHPTTQATIEASGLASPSDTPLPDDAIGVELSLIAGPPSLVRGEPRAVWVRVRNTSPETLRAGDGACSLRLGNHWWDMDGNVIVYDDGRARLPYDLHPNGEALLQLFIAPPTSAGDLILELDMVQEGVRWFAAAGSPTLRIAYRDIQSAEPVTLHGQVLAGNSDRPAPAVGAVDADGASPLHVKPVAAGWRRWYPPSVRRRKIL